MATYRHTQIGYLTLAASLAAIASSVHALRSRPAVAAAVALLLVIVGIVFSSLTIEVDGAELRSRFGPGMWRRGFPLASIVDATPTTSSWWEGWGIRLTPRGVLYTVSGTRAVEVVLRTGQRFRLGTDEPDTLAAAIRASIAELREAGRAASDNGPRRTDGPSSTGIQRQTT
jgi:hypothetical protein